jgi:hypothetical protein
MRSQNEDVLRYLPALGHDQSCLWGGLSDLDPRRYRRGPPRRRPRYHSRLGHLGRPEDGLPRRCHGDLRVALLRCRHGRRFSGNRHLGLTPRSHLNFPSRGVEYPLGLPRSSRRDLGVPTPGTDGASPLGGWLDDSWPSLKPGLRPRRAAMSSSSSSSSPSSSSSDISGDGSLGSPSLSCRRRSFSKASRARVRSRARAFFTSFFFFFSSAVTRARCSVHRVLRDPWPGRLVTPYLLETDEKSRP